LPPAEIAGGLGLTIPRSSASGKRPLNPYLSTLLG
jgi:hypothetical protein